MSGAGMRGGHFAVGCRVGDGEKGWCSAFPIWKTFRLSQCVCVDTRVSDGEGGKGRCKVYYIYWFTSDVLVMDGNLAYICVVLRKF